MTDTPDRDTIGRAAHARPAGSGTSMATSNKALIVALLAGLIGLAVFLFASPGDRLTASAKTCQVGERDCLPDVKFVDMEGVAHTPESLAGKVVVVNFWATWCGPCLKEIPDLSSVYERYKDQGLVMLGVLTKDDVDNQSLLNFRSDTMMSYPVVRMSSEIQGGFGQPSGLPTTFIYDRRGKRAYPPHAGALRADHLAQLVEPLLAAK